MLNPFPDLLVFTFFAPTLLRVAAGIALLYVAYAQYHYRHRLAQIEFPVVGKGAWIAYVSILFHLIVGLMLVFGWYTQIAALLGLIGSLKGYILVNYYGFIPLSRSSLLLLAVILLSILFTGAGAFAFDLPL